MTASPIIRERIIGDCRMIQGVDDSNWSISARIAEPKPLGRVEVEIVRGRG